MIRLAVAGALGRTGGTVLAEAARDERFEVVAALIEPDTDQTDGRDHLDSSIEVGNRQLVLTDQLQVECDVLIDFTHPAGTMHWVNKCVGLRLPMVSGTTGLSAEQIARLKAAGRTIPLVHASNFSVGIHLLRQAAKLLAQELGPGFDIEVVEAHHRHKQDAPSGTALTLLDDLLEVTGGSREQDAIFGREGRTGPRPTGQIGVHALRLGEVVGRHEVHFSSAGETLTLSHTAHSRAAFAAGALRAATWIMGKPAGFYGIEDVVG